MSESESDTGAKSHNIGTSLDVQTIQLADTHSPLRRIRSAYRNVIRELLMTMIRWMSKVLQTTYIISGKDHGMLLNLNTPLKCITTQSRHDIHRFRSVKKYKL